MVEVAAQPPVPVQASVRTLTPDDLPQVARIHCAAFPHSALARLGFEAVRRYYEWQLLGPHQALALGVEVEGELAGFCFAGVFNGALSGFLRRNRGFLLRRLLLRPWLIANPLILERSRLSLRLLRRKRPAQTQAVQTQPRLRGTQPRLRGTQPRLRGTQPRLRGTPSAPARDFGVLSIAVLPEHRRRGLGALLMERVEQAARQAGFTQITLSVHAENQPAIQFYQRLGWRKLMQDGFWHGLMVKDILEQGR